jgi:hypothetical protein
MYHDLPHADEYAPLKVVNALMVTGCAQRPLLRREEQLAVTRPDISTQVRFRKEEGCARAETLRAEGHAGAVRC